MKKPNLKLPFNINREINLCNLIYYIIIGIPIIYIYIYIYIL